MAIDAFTKLLLNFEDYPFTDSSNSGHAITNVGPVTRSNTQSKFGNYSGYFTGGPYLYAADNEDWNFGIGDFTVDAWIYPTTLTGVIFSQGGGYSDSSRFYISGNGSMSYFREIPQSTYPVSMITGAGVITLNDWHHVALIRYGDEWRIYINGTSQALDTWSGDYGNISSPCQIGTEFLGTYDYPGYIDEFRISKGIARWTSDFTPPTIPYAAIPTSGSYAYTIYNGYIDEDLSWFPATVSLSASAYSDFFGNLDDTNKKYYFEDASGNKLYTEVENMDMANELATFHTAVPTVPSGANTALTFNWDFLGDRDYSVRELPATDYDYDFTGANGSQPDSTYFTANPTAPATVEIQSNKLNVYIASGVNNPADATYVPKLYGNFDVQVDYDLTTYPNSSYWGIMLSITDSNGAGADMIRGRYNYHAYRTYLAGWQTQTSTGDTSGKLRITRIGNTWTTYFWGGSSWTQNYTTDVATDPGEVTVKLLNRHGDTLPEVEANWDNFTVNSIEYDQDEVNDDFTGSDGDDPDVMKWTPYDNLPKLQGNKLRCAVYSGHNRERSRNKSQHTGNFDVQVDYNIVSSQDFNGWFGGIRVIVGSNNFEMGRAYRDGSNRYTTWETGLPWSAYSNTSDTSGQIRVTRIGSTVYGYYYDSGWQLLRTFAIGAGDALVLVGLDTFTGLPTATLDFDNFQINGSDSMTGWTEDTGNVPAQQVWDSNFKIVTHLADTPTGSADDILDSTANEYHGRSYNMAAGNSGSNEYGKYITFDGSNEFIDFGDAFYSDALTIEAVANPYSFITTQPRMIAIKRNIAGTSTTDSANTEWAMQFSNSTTIGWSAYGDIQDDIVAASSKGGLTPTGIEQYVAGSCGVYDGGDTTQINYNDVITDGYRDVSTIHNGPLAIQLGARSNNNNNRWLHGHIREFRVSNIYRSEAWRIATYYSLFGILYESPIQDETLTIQNMTVATSSDDITNLILNLVIQNLDVSTSSDDITNLILNLVIQNLDVSTSADLIVFTLELDINNLNISTILNEMTWTPTQLSHINTTVDMGTLLRALTSATPKRTVDVKTIKRTLGQIQ